MKKLLTVLTLASIGHCAIAQSITFSPDGYAPYYAVASNSSFTPLTAVNTDDENYTVEVVVSGDDVYMTVTGVEFVPESYYITDMQSNVVQQGTPEVVNNTMHIVFDSSLPTGDYLLTAKTRNNSFTHPVSR